MNQQFQLAGAGEGALDAVADGRYFAAYGLAYDSGANTVGNSSAATECDETSGYR